MCILTGREIERLLRLAESWRREYFAELTRLLREDDARDARSRDTNETSPAPSDPGSR